jgi:hypothetical protein
VSRGRLTCWVALVITSTAACGSTVPQATGRAGAGNDGLTSSYMRSAGDVPAQREGSGAGIASAPGTAGLAGASQPSTGGPDQQPSSSLPSRSGGGAGRLGPGVTAHEIKVGFLYSDDEGTVAKTLGVKGISPSDTVAQYQALAADLNSRGGILGRRIVLVPYNQSTAGYTSQPASSEQAACSYWTEDNPVFAVFSSGLFSLTPCLASHRVTTVLGGGWVDEAAAANLREFAAGGIYYRLLAKVFVDRLVAQGYFTGWNTATGQPAPTPAKVGMLYEDTPEARHYYAIVRAELTARHIQMAPDYIYELGVDTQASGSQNAVLKFASEGVTHVFHAAFFFFQAAQNQQYRPRYSIDSVVPPALTAQNVGASQLHGALGVGFMPTQDVDAAQDPGDVSPQVRRCKDIMRKAGVPAPASRDAQFSLVSQCESMWALAEALKTAGRPDPDALSAAFRALGARPSVITFTEHWGGGRRASAGTVADLRYVDSCSCFSYTSVRTAF